MKIGIYGGSFNPPHLGHFAAAHAAMDSLCLDRLLIVPASDPPHKDMPAGSASPEDRLAMASIMADQIGAECWDIEIIRRGVSYSVDTLETAAQMHPDDELWLLMGSDMFLSLHSWRNPGRIMELAHICAFARAKTDCVEQLKKQKLFLEDAYGAKIELIEIPDLVEISSTDIRAALKSGSGGKLIHESVYGYILRNNLYGVDRDLSKLNTEDLRCVSYSMVKAKRLPHIRGTEQTAVELAERWGANIEDMRRAAILHDCTKYCSKEEHLSICDRYGIELDQMERSAEKLLHSKSGAALSKFVFGSNEDIFTSILYHTTGRGGMTLEEKILYLADYIEPCRTFPEVTEMRRLAKIDLNRAVLMGVRLSIEEMKERNRVVHHNTLEAESSLLAEIEDQRTV